MHYLGYKKVRALHISADIILRISLPKTELFFVFKTSLEIIFVCVSWL